MSIDIICKSVKLPFNIFNMKVEIFQDTELTKLMGQEVALTQEPLEGEMVTINMEQYPNKHGLVPHKAADTGGEEH